MSDCGKWQPITWHDLSNIIDRSLRTCCPEDRAFYEQHRIMPMSVGLKRTQGVEQVFAVAQIEDRVVFYDDVEDAFEVARLGGNGVLEFDCCGQFEFQEALAHIRRGWR